MSFLAVAGESLATETSLFVLLIVGSRTRYVLGVVCSELLRC